MSQDVYAQVSFFLYSVRMGILITFVYDGFVILRRLMKHNLMLISLEDMVFWIACAIGVFYMLYEENNGILRWFAVFGAAIGMLLYKKSVSTLYVNIMSTLIRRIFKLISKIIGVICRPIAFLWGKICRIFKVFGRKSRKSGKYIKNKLTRGLKLLKITLCKQ